MTDDAIQREIRDFRDAFAAAHGYDIRAMFETLRNTPLPPGFKLVTLPPRPAKPLPAPTTPPEAA